MKAMDGLEQRQRTYWNERFRQHWGPEGAGSVHLGRQFNAWRYRVRRAVFRRVVRRLGLDPGTLSVLDVGSGTGFYLGQWQALRAASISGLDISDWAVSQLAQIYPNATLYELDIAGAHLPLPAQAFDVVTAIDVLTHVLDDAAYLRALGNIHRSLKPGGYLLYTDSFFHGPGKRFEDYWRGRSLNAIAADMDAAGFEIVSRDPFSVLMSAPTDTRHRQRNERIWDRVMIPVLRRNWIGFFYGAFLYPIELFLVSTLRESPAIELMVCRKRS
jgi:SAM-dependent methyltransferase